MIAQFNYEGRKSKKALTSRTSGFLRGEAAKVAARAGRGHQKKAKKASPPFSPFTLLYCNDYWEIAPVGQAETQLPHSMQVSALTFAFPSSTTMASTGHVPTHASQLTQASASTTAFAMKSPPIQ
jgi:hypothetical protein